MPALWAIPCQAASKHVQGLSTHAHAMPCVSSYPSPTESSADSPRPHILIWSAQYQDQSASWVFREIRPLKLQKLLGCLCACQAVRQWLLCFCHSPFAASSLFHSLSPGIPSWLWPCRPLASPHREQAAKQRRLLVHGGAKECFSKPHT